MDVTDISKKLQALDAPRVVIVGAWDMLTPEGPTSVNGDHSVAVPPRAELYVIEPLPACAELLRAKADARDCFGSADASQRTHVIECAISDHDGRETFHFIANYGMASSLREPGSAIGLGPTIWDSPKRDIEVDVRRMDSLMDAGQLPPGADYLTIDVQGSELEVLRGAERFLAGTSMVFVEVTFREMYKGQALWPEIRDFLVARGFGQDTKFDPILEQGWWSDALFVRP